MTDLLKQIATLTKDLAALSAKVTDQATQIEHLISVNALQSTQLKEQSASIDALSTKSAELSDANALQLEFNQQIDSRVNTCEQAHNDDPYQFGLGGKQQFRFGGKQKCPPWPYGCSGFSIMENGHRWTEGTSASLTVPDLLDQRVTAIELVDAQAIVPKITIWLNDIENQNVFFVAAQRKTIRIDIPAESRGIIRIRFEIANPVSPAELGLAADQRKLGLLLRRARFYTVAKK